MKCFLQLPLPKPEFQGGTVGAAKIFRAESDPACIHPKALRWAWVRPPWEAPGAQQLPVTSFYKNAFEKRSPAPGCDVGPVKERQPPPARGRAALPHPPSPSRLLSRSRGTWAVSVACRGSSRWRGRRASACVRGLTMQLWGFPLQRQGVDPLERDRTRAQPSAPAQGGCPAVRGSSRKPPQLLQGRAGGSLGAIHE